MQLLTGLISRAATVLFFFVFLTSCSGGGGGGAPAGSGPGPAAAMLSGTAATGNAFAGTLNIIGALNVQVNNIPVDPTNGTWSANVTGLMPPFNIQGVPTNPAQSNLYGYAAAANTVANVTSLSTLAMFIANGSLSLDALYTNWASGGSSLSPAAILNGQAVINANFSTLFQNNGVAFATYNFMTAAFTANGIGIDAVLDALGITIDMNAGMFTVTVSSAPFSFNPSIDTSNIDIGGGGGTPVACGTPGAGIPVQFANLEGEFMLAIYVSNDSLFPLNAQRTEYLFRVCADGSVSILDSSGTTQLHSQIWDGGIGDFAITASGDSVTISDSDGIVNTALNFKSDSFTGLYMASLSVGPGALGVGGGIWDSDPGIRGSAPPQELLDLAGTTPMQRLTGAAMQLGEVYSLTVDGITGMTTLGPPSNLTERSLGWNTQYSRVEVYNATDPYYRIRLLNGIGSRIDITFDGTSGGITLASGVFGSIDGGGNYGTVALSEVAPVTAATDIGTSFTPGRPLVTDTVNVLSLQYNVVVVGGLKVDLFINYDRSFDSFGVSLFWITDLAAQQSVLCGSCTGITLDETARTIALDNVPMIQIGGSGTATLSATSLKY